MVKPKAIEIRQAGPSCRHMKDELLSFAEFTSCRRANGECRGTIKEELPDPITYEDVKAGEGMGTFTVKHNGKPIWVYHYINSRK